MPAGDKSHAPRWIGTWQQAEKWAAAVVASWGYDVTATQLTNDKGLDFRGPDVAGQVKLQEQPVGREAVQRLRGASPPGAAMVFFASAGYTKNAVAFADEYGIALFDFDRYCQFRPLNSAAADFYNRGQKIQRDRAAAERARQLEQQRREDAQRRQQAWNEAVRRRYQRGALSREQAEQDERAYQAALTRLGWLPTVRGLLIVVAACLCVGGIAASAQLLVAGPILLALALAALVAWWRTAGVVRTARETLTTLAPDAAAPTGNPHRPTGPAADTPTGRTATAQPPGARLAVGARVRMVGRRSTGSTGTITAIVRGGLEAHVRIDAGHTLYFATADELSPL